MNFEGPGEGQWKVLPGGGSSIAINDEDAIWIVGGEGKPHYWENLPDGSGDWPVPPETSLVNLISIAVEPNGLAWAINTEGTIFRRTGDGIPGESWETMPGGGTDIAIGAGGHVWTIGGDGVPHYWENLPGGSGDWPVPPGIEITGAKKIAVGEDGLPWIITSSNTIMRREGTSFPGSSWVTVEGTASDIAIGANGAVWILDAAGHPQYWNGTSWITLDEIVLVSIAVDAKGSPIGVRDTTEILRWSRSDEHKKGMTGITQAWWPSADASSLAVFAGGLVFQCSSLTQLSKGAPPWFVSDLLARSGTPNMLGDMTAISDLPDGRVIAFFSDQFVIFTPNPSGDTNLQFAEKGNLSDITQSINGVDFAFLENGRTCLVQGSLSVTIEWSGSGWSVSAVTPAPFTGKAPASWAKVDAMWLDQPGTPNATYYAFSDDQFVSWPASGSGPVSTPEHIVALFDWIPNGRKRSAPAGFNQTEFEEEYKASLRSAHSLATQADAELRSSIDDLGWYSGPSTALQHRLSHVVRTNTEIATGMESANNFGCSYLYVGNSYSVSFIGAITWGVGLFISTDGNHSMASASLGGGAGLTIGGGASLTFGYFWRPVEALVGANFVMDIQMEIIAGFGAQLYFDSQGLAGFTVSGSKGAGVSFLTLEGAHTWDMAQWDNPPDA
ncbi:tectonin domain-containing protein [uncultured Erythrobacter sp.]|uniref:tectonin domain-containing protein n=1 Tax=uncultured Erythrobacter sp. TaxID=263913 RepID=UPI00261E9AE3|nr:tectonin domain-containing protein [uncultured Erythrobacter sp.]